MSEWITELDPCPAQDLADRWHACSPEARQFAATYGGRFAPLLPHVVAEMYDQGQLDELRVPVDLGVRA